MFHPYVVQKLADQRIQELREEAKRAGFRRHNTQSKTTTSRRSLRRWAMARPS